MNDASVGQEAQALGARRRGRVARLAAAFGDEAADRLAASTVGVLGASGTGSPALEVFARAGVGHIITIDPDHFTASNLERVHGSMDADVDREPAKVALAWRHITSINPDCRVTAIRGRLPQPSVIDALVHADVVLGCTDQQHSRLALSDLSVRYCVPVIDCGVGLEGKGGLVTGLVLELLRLLPTDACVLCRKMISATRTSQELMSPEERQARQAAAVEARARGDAAGAYWLDEPQLNTVGFLTTAAGALAAAYAIGWITGRFSPPFDRVQMNLAAPYFDFTDDVVTPRTNCTCRHVRGQADQAAEHALITAPAHWPAPLVLTEPAAL